jgi:thiamine biosynthesis protein ThiS
MLTLIVNGRATAVPSGSSIADLLRLLALEGKRIAVERNGEIVPRSALGQALLADGDRLEIVVAVGGG